MSGQISHLAGLSAEDRVAADYEDRGMTMAARRWRGPGGEIDLVARDGAALVFIEVKKSRDFAAAAARVTRRQTERIMASAAAFLADEPAGQDTEMRFDVALVDGMGRIQRAENAFCL